MEWIDGPVVDHPETVITSMRGELQPACVPLYTKGGVIEESVLEIGFMILTIGDTLWTWNDEESWRPPKLRLAR